MSRAMENKRQIGEFDRSKFRSAHNDTVLVQPVFDTLSADDIKPGVLGYTPCWAMLEPGMTVEAHNHATPEFYVFTKGNGLMSLDGETFEVQEGMAVNIPPDVVHEVANSDSAAQPLVWLSIGLKV